MKALLLLAISGISAGLAWPVLKTAATDPHSQAVVANLKSLVTLDNSNNDNVDNQDAASKFAAAAAQTSMPAADLQRNLGDPVQIFRNNDSQTWYYPTVIVIIDHRNRVVSSRLVPVTGARAAVAAHDARVLAGRLPETRNHGIGGISVYETTTTTSLEPATVPTPAVASTSASAQGGNFIGNSAGMHGSNASSGSTRVWSSGSRASVPYNTQSTSKWSN